MTSDPGKVNTSVIMRLECADEPFLAAHATRVSKKTHKQPSRNEPSTKLMTTHYSAESTRLSLLGISQENARLQMCQPLCAGFSLLVI